jgi:hypothetical protein
MQNFDPTGDDPLHSAHTSRNCSPQFPQKTARSSTLDPHFEHKPLPVVKTAPGADLETEADFSTTSCDIASAAELNKLTSQDGKYILALSFSETGLTSCSSI